MEYDNPDYPKIRHCYYEKEMNTDLVIENGTAIAKKDVKTILSQEEIRRIRNCDKNTKEEERKF